MLTGGTTTTTDYFSVNGQTLAETVNGTLSYLVTDLLSNVVMAIGANGTAAAVNLYEPYGKVNYSWGSMPTDKNYTGQQRDSQSGLLYYKFRWYDPLTGEFTRTDTRQDNAIGMNPYAYVGDNPETKNDPTGHWGWGTIALIVAVVVVVAIVAVVAAPVLIAAAAATAEVAASASAAATVAAIAVADAAPVVLNTVAVVGTIAGLVSAAAGGGGCALSFRADTDVAISKGEQAINTLKVGQKVLAYNPQTQKMEQEPIEKVWLNYDKDLVDLTLVATVKDAHGKTTQQKEVLHTNEKHPFLTKEKGFIPVSQLKPGMHILEANGSYGVVAALVVVPGGMWMYNLTVTQDHTYVVGLDQWIVHNCTPGLNSDNLGTANGFDGTLTSHFRAHGNDAGINAPTKAIYQQQATEFMSNDPGAGVLQIWNESTGQYYRYDPQTGLFGISNAKGNVVTFFNLKEDQGDNAESYFYKQYWATPDKDDNGNTTYSSDAPENPTAADVNAAQAALEQENIEMLRLMENMDE